MSEEIENTFPLSGTFSSLNDLTRWLEEKKRRGWWRGQPNAKDKLIPGIFRNKEDTEWESTKYHLFKVMALSRYEKCPSEIFEWPFLMKHYGLQTRLLDWTQSPLIATFFAVSKFNENKEDEKEKEKADGALWLLSPSLLTKKMFPDSKTDIFLPLRFQ